MSAPERDRARIGLETERDARRQETFMVAKMLAGHGALRPECAIELRATPRPA